MFPFVIDGQIILPSDPFWLLRVPVKQGESVPFKLQMFYHWQWGMKAFAEPNSVEQADGFQ